METNLDLTSTEGLSSAIPPATGSSRINVGQAERIISIIAGTGLSVLAVRKWNTLYGKALGAIGAILLKRGVTGYCEINRMVNRDTAKKKAPAVEVSATFAVARPRTEVYEFWRNLENLPRFMKHLEEVEELDERRSSWSAKLPGWPAKISWEAVIQEEVPNRQICWSSLPGSTIDNAGEVRFEDSSTPGETLVHASISYRLPAGDIGGVAGKFLNPMVERLIREDLHGFKSVLERTDAGKTSQKEELTGFGRKA